MAIFQPSVILRMKIRLFFDDSDGDACRKMSPYHQLCLRLLPGGIGPKAGPDGPSAHSVFSADS